MARLSQLHPLPKVASVQSGPNARNAPSVLLVMIGAATAHLVVTTAMIADHAAAVIGIVDRLLTGAAIATVDQLLIVVPTEDQIVTTEIASPLGIVIADQLPTEAATVTVDQHPTGVVTATVDQLPTGAATATNVIAVHPATVTVDQPLTVDPLLIATVVTTVIAAQTVDQIADVTAVTASQRH